MEKMTNSLTMFVCVMSGALIFASLNNPMPAFAEEVILFNGDVEISEDNNPLGWEKIGTLPEVEFFYDLSTDKTNHSLKIVNTNKEILQRFGPPNWAQTITANIPRGKVIRVSSFIATRDVDGFAAVALQCWKNNKIIAFGTTEHIKLISGTQDWTELAFSVKVPKGTKTMRVLCMLNGTGTVWFDRMTLTPGALTSTSLQPGQIVGIIGGILGSVFGIGGGIVGTLYGRNRKKYYQLMINFLYVMTALGAISLVTGLFAYAANSWHRDCRYGLVLGGVIFLLAGGINLICHKKFQKNIDQFKEKLSKVE